MASAPIGAAVSGVARQLLLLASPSSATTTKFTVACMRNSSTWSASTSRHPHTLARRLHPLVAVQTLQPSDQRRVHVAFSFTSGSGDARWTSTADCRAFSTLPSTGGSNSSNNSRSPPDDQQKRRDDEAMTIKKKLAADIERARKLALHQVVNMPNVITFARILSTPYLAYLIVDAQYEPAIALLAVAGLSDWLDGYIARTYKQESIIGSFLDPFADKLMIGALSLSMLGSGLLPWPLVALVFGRDVLLVSGTFYHRLHTKDADSAFFDTSDSGAFEVKPTLLSKVNTALQIALFGLTLTNAAWQLPVDPALHALFGVVGLTTFASGSEYLWSYVNQTGAFRPLTKARKPKP